MSLPPGLAPAPTDHLSSLQRAERMREEAAQQRQQDAGDGALIAAVAAQVASAAPPAGAYVHWPAFVADVDAAWTEPGLERDPSKTLDSFAHTVATSPHPRFVRPELPADQQVRPPAEGAEAQAHERSTIPVCFVQADLESALDAIRGSIRRWRLYNLKPSLEDYDRASEGMVTETQFLRTLAMFRLVPETPGQRAAVLAYFRGKGIKKHLIDYRAFLLAAYEEGMA